MALDRNNSMLLDIQYVRGDRKNKIPDYIYMIWKEIRSGKKHLITIPNPTLDIYFEKKEFRDYAYNKNYEHLEKLDKVTVKYSDLYKAIADDIGPVGKDFLKNIYSTGDFRRMNELFSDPYSFGADIDIRAFYRIKWMEHLDNSIPKPITKGFSDIEADSIRIKGFADPEKDCPVDLVTLIDNTTKTSYTFSLVHQEFHRSNPELLSDERADEEERLAQLFESRHMQEDEVINDMDGLKKELSEEFSEHYGDIDYRFYFFDDEAKMLISLFQLINELKLDFIVFWNIAFDIPYMMKRCEVLGLDPKEVMCHPDFPVKECYFKKDVRNHLPKNKSDFFKISSYTIFYDQMELYAAVRKSEKELRSLKLTDIAKAEIGDEKLDYSEDGNIKTLPYINFRKYIIYNIKDTLLQYGIEERATDLETLYVSSYKNATPYEQVFKQTLKLRYVQFLSYIKQKLVPGNNINAIFSSKSEDTESEDDDDDETTYEGALVGNPLLIANFGRKMYGSMSNSIFDSSIDMDMGAFYPNTIYSHNIDPSTLIFKMLLPADQFSNRGGKLKYHGITDVQMVPDNDDSFQEDVSKEVMDNFQTKNYLSFGHKWLNLPTVTKLFMKCKEELG